MINKFCHIFYHKQLNRYYYLTTETETFEELKTYHFINSTLSESEFKETFQFSTEDRTLASKELNQHISKLKLNKDFE